MGPTLHPARASRAPRRQQTSENVVGSRPLGVGGVPTLGHGPTLRPRHAAREGRAVRRSDPKSCFAALSAAVGRSAGPSRKRAAETGRSIAYRGSVGGRRLDYFNFALRTAACVECGVCLVEMQGCENGRVKTLCSFFFF